MALPFFGLILLGYLAAKFSKLTVDGLAWMNFFVIYIALPALFFSLLSQTPVEKLASWGFVLTSVLGTYCAFAIAFCVGVFSSDGDINESTIQGLAGAYGNIGYMGPGLAIAALGPEAAVPVALIFCFDNALHFTLTPTLMAIGGSGPRQSARDTAINVLKLEANTHSHSNCTEAYGPQLIFSARCQISLVCLSASSFSWCESRSGRTYS